jgi:colicin import membrane protein
LPKIKNIADMKKILIAILTLIPMLATAQDNTWERIEQEPVEAANPDAKYLVPDAVPVVDGKVCWTTTISAPGKSAQQIYDILLAQLEKMVKEPNQIEGSAIVVKDTQKHELGAVFHEWLVFKSASLSFDRTRFNFVIEVDCSNEKAKVIINRITYDYDLDRDPKHYTAEEWITDEYAVNKKHTKLYPLSAKFRRKTIDRKDFIFNKFETLLNAK